MLTHSGEKPFSCKQCDYSCTTGSQLKRHTKTHSGNKPFKCTQCDYSCTRANSLKKHMFNHSGEKAFRCEKCNYSCVEANALKKHKRRHTQFVRICCATDTDKLSQLARGAKKTPFFGGFLSIFRPVPCFWALYMYMAGIFWKENGFILLFLAAGTTDTKFRRSTGLTTANSTNKYQKYKSVELGDQLVNRVTVISALWFTDLWSRRTIDCWRPLEPPRLSER